MPDDHVRIGMIPAFIVIYPEAHSRVNDMPHGPEDLHRTNTYASDGHIPIYLVPYF
jgi:hypothetical protein